MIQSKAHKSNTDLELTVTEGCGLLDFLLQRLTKKSRNNVKSMLTHREVTVDGRVVTKHDHPLKPGQTVRILLSADRELKRRDQPKILFEDDELIVLNKPAGLLTVSAEFSGEETAYRQVTGHVRRTNPKARVFIVHRLDRDTSGVVLFAKNERLKLALQDDWNSLVTTRGYAAVAEGQLREKSGRIHTWLKETKTLLMYSSHTPGDGLEAITNYRVLRESPVYSLLQVELETGRKNQIRVHLKELGHPVAGDKKYGAHTDPLKRLCLHANVLELTHPFTGKPLRFETDIPQKFSNLLNPPAAK